MKTAVNEHILFVDDEAPIRELLSLYFRKKGLQVTTAMTSEQAKELAGQGPFNLAIVDVNLAGENGLDLLAFFKKNYPQVPVIIFTGLTGEELVDQARAAGADGFMRKTESLGKLYDEVSRHLLKS
jgi:DNA-binding response OmpR family regulator